MNMKYIERMKPSNSQKNDEKFSEEVFTSDRKEKNSDTKKIGIFDLVKQDPSTINDTVFMQTVRELMSKKAELETQSTKI